MGRDYPNPVATAIRQAVLEQYVQNNYDMNGQSTHVISRRAKWDDSPIDRVIEQPRPSTAPSRGSRGAGMVDPRTGRPGSAPGIGSGLLPSPTQEAEGAAATKAGAMPASPWAVQSSNHTRKYRTLNEVRVSSHRRGTFFGYQSMDAGGSLETDEAALKMGTACDVRWAPSERAHSTLIPPAAATAISQSLYLFISPTRPALNPRRPPPSPHPTSIHLTHLASRRTRAEPTCEALIPQHPSHSPHPTPPHRTQSTAIHFTSRRTPS